MLALRKAAVNESRKAGWVRRSTARRTLRDVRSGGLLGRRWARWSPRLSDCGCWRSRHHPENPNLRLPCREVFSPPRPGGVSARLKWRDPLPGGRCGEVHRGFWALGRGPYTAGCRCAPFFPKRAKSPNQAYCNVQANERVNLPVMLGNSRASPGVTPPSRQRVPNLTVSRGPTPGRFFWAASRRFSVATGFTGAGKSAWSLPELHASSRVHVLENVALFPPTCRLACAPKRWKSGSADSPIDSALA